MMKTPKLFMLFAFLFGLTLALTALRTPVFAATTDQDEPMVIAQSGGDDWDDWDEEEEEEEDAFGNILEVSYAVFNDVTATPGAAGAATAVTAKITFEDETEEASISKVEIVYSVNGGAPAAAAMTDAGDGSWKGEIPGQASDAKVDYIIKVTDSNNNVSASGSLGAANKVATVDDIDNSADIVQDEADILGLAASYDAENVYVDFSVQGKVDGGTIDPPYIRLYGIKFTNPEDTEGLLVGKLWAYLPLAQDKAVQEKFMPLLMDQGAEYVQKIGKENIDAALASGQLVLDIGALMGGNTEEGLIFTANPTAKVDGGKFTGQVKRSAMGVDGQKGYRVIIITLANASIDSFMPIPLNCSNFLTVYTDAKSYTVK